jgi:rubredoxin
MVFEEALMSKQTAAPTKPKDCPYFGQELPTGWRCPPCPLAKACFEAYTNPATFVPDWTPPPNTSTAHQATSPTSHSQTPGA